MPRPSRRMPAPSAMIVAPQPEAVEAGKAVLAAGGSAVDATLACAFTQGVVDPMMSGIGGLGVMQVFDPARGEHVVLDGLSTCPAACTAEMWAGRFERECSDGYGYVLRGAVNELGHGAVTTPGILRLFADAHARFGRVAWSELLAGAIERAAEGWLVRPHVAGVFATDERGYGRLPYAAKLSATADGRALYLREDGSPKRVGDLVRNPWLAETLGDIARDGVEAFYTGRCRGASSPTCRPTAACCRPPISPDFARAFMRRSRSPTAAAASRCRRRRPVASSSPRCCASWSGSISSVSAITPPAISRWSPRR